MIKVDRTTEEEEKEEEAVALCQFFVYTGSHAPTQVASKRPASLRSSLKARVCEAPRPNCIVQGSLTSLGPAQVQPGTCHGPPSDHAAESPAAPVCLGSLAGNQPRGSLRLELSRQLSRQIGRRLFGPCDSRGSSRGSAEFARRGSRGRDSDSGGGRRGE